MIFNFQQEKKYRPFGLTEYVGTSTRHVMATIDFFFIHKVELPAIIELKLVSNF